MVEALSFQPIFGWGSQPFVEQITRQSPNLLYLSKNFNIKHSSMGFRSAFFFISLMGVVFMASTMACSTTFWTLSSLLLLEFEAMIQEVVAYSNNNKCRQKGEHTNSV